MALFLFLTYGLEIFSFLPHGHRQLISKVSLKTSAFETGQLIQWDLPLPTCEGERLALKIYNFISDTFTIM